MNTQGLFELPVGVITVSYIAATVLFILALGGLSNQETARRGNWYGITGMAIALFATLFGRVSENYDLLIVFHGPDCAFRGHRLNDP